MTKNKMSDSIPLTIFVLFLLKNKPMKAIEIKSKTDSRGLLKIDCDLKKSNSRVKVIILIENDQKEKDEEILWMQSISSNPSFNYLNDPAEDIYSITDGEPIDD
jgi:hypothetical protein